MHLSHSTDIAKLDPAKKSREELRRHLLATLRRRLDEVDEYTTNNEWGTALGRADDVKAIVQALRALMDMR